VKVGDLVRIWFGTARAGANKVGVIVSFKSFEHGKNPQPIVLIDGKLRLVGAPVCEVVNESR
jgi:hypothetical protein